MKKMYKLPEGVDYSYKAGIPGLYNEKGELVRRVEDMSAQELSTYEADYRRRRGEAQIKVDQQINALEKKRQDEARAKAAREKAESQEPKPAEPEPAKPKPEPQKQPPKQSPVAQYMAAAAAARKSGDPVQMAKVRDQGMAIWRAKYKDTLAKKVDFESRPTGRSIGTGQSQMEKDAAELRAIRPAGKPGQDMGAAKPLQKVQAVSQPAATSLETQVQQQGVKPLDTSKLERSRVRRTVPNMVSASYEPYDLVLGYLISEGHADTVEEANYIMMQMDAENIQSIVETLSI